MNFWQYPIETSQLTISDEVHRMNTLEVEKFWKTCVLLKKFVSCRLKSGQQSERVHTQESEKSSKKLSTELAHSICQIRPLVRILNFGITHSCIESIHCKVYIVKGLHEAFFSRRYQIGLAQQNRK